MIDSRNRTGISVEHDILPLLEKEVHTLIQNFPEEEQQIYTLLGQFREAFLALTINEPAHAQFCETAVAWIEVRCTSPELLEEIKQARLRIFKAIVQQRITSASPTIIRESFSHHERSNGVRKKPRSTEELRETLSGYASLLVLLEDEELVDLLIQIGVLQHTERRHSISFISEYLGTSTIEFSGNGIESILHLDPSILRSPTLFERIKKVLVQHCFEKLMEEKADTMEQHRASLTNVDRDTKKWLDIFFDKIRTTNKLSEQHEQLYNAVLKFMRTAASHKIPKHMAQTSTDRNGVVWPLGSWRQRIAVTYALEHKQFFVALAPGKGKTFVYAWLRELLAEQKKKKEDKSPTRMILFVPSITLDEHPSRFRIGSSPKQADEPYYPDLDTAPTVGVIKAGITLKEMQKHAQQEIVLIAYSMLGMSRHNPMKSQNASEEEQEVELEVETTQEEDRVHLLQVLAENKFDVATIDESQNLQGGNTWHQQVEEVIHAIRKTEKHAHIILGSGTPITGEINGLAVQMSLLEDEKEKPMRTGKKVEVTIDPITMRKHMGNMWKPDEKADLVERFATFNHYLLSKVEMEFLEGIAHDSSIPAMTKQMMLLRFIRCPQRVSGDESMPWTSFAKTIESIQTLQAEGRNSILITENMLAEGVLRGADNKEMAEIFDGDEDTFVHQLQNYCEIHNIHFHVIHGKVPKKKRLEILKTIQEQHARVEKVILYGHTSCFGVGIDLSNSFNGIISQEPAFNMSTLEQLIGRVARKGNEKLRVIVQCAEDTIEQGILQSALEKQAESDRVLHGLSGGKRLLNDGERISENRRKFMEKPEQAWKRLLHDLHNSGGRVKEFWLRNIELFQKLHAAKQTTSVGDIDRAIATLVRYLEDTNVLPKNGHYLQTNSFGQQMHTQLSEDNKPRTITSMDPTQNMYAHSTLSLSHNSHFIEGVADELYTIANQHPEMKAAQDLIVLQGFEQTSHAVTEQFQFTGRVRALQGANTLLKENGVLMIPFEGASITSEGYKNVKASLAAFGFEVVEFPQSIHSSDNYDEKNFSMHVIIAKKVLNAEPEMIMQLESELLTLPKAKERVSQKLATEIPHNTFKIQRKEYEAPKPCDVSVAVEQLLTLRECVSYIREVCPTIEHLEHETKNRKESTLLRELKTRWKVTMMPLDKHAKKKISSKPRFTMNTIKHAFYPYDACWD